MDIFVRPARLDAVNGCENGKLVRTNIADELVNRSMNDRNNEIPRKKSGSVTRQTINKSALQAELEGNLILDRRSGIKN